MLTENRYGKYCLPKESIHRPACRTVLGGDLHEPKTIEYILKYAGDRDIIHAGAYFGDMLPSLSQIKGTVYAFEPDPTNYKCALQTISLNNLANVILFKRGLSYATGDVSFLNERSGVSLGGGSRIADHGKINIKTMEIDSLGADPSVIHLDIEGHEYYALHGAIKTIEKSKPIIILEDNSVPTKELMKSLGYKNTKRIHNNRVWRIK